MRGIHNERLHGPRYDNCRLPGVIDQQRETGQRGQNELIAPFEIENVVCEAEQGHEGETGHCGGVERGVGVVLRGNVEQAEDEDVDGVGDEANGLWDRDVTSWRALLADVFSG